MQNYRLTLLLNNELSEADRKSTLDAISKKFGKITKEDSWGSRSLSYEIKHKSKAFYVNYDFEIDPKDVLALDKMLKLDEEVMRYLLIRLSK